MMIPSILVREVASAEGLVSMDGEFPALVRKRLLELIEDLSASEHVNAGYLRRARLALICAAEVMGRLKPYPEVFSMAESAMSNGVAALSGKCDLATLERQNEAYHTKVVALFAHGEVAFVPVYAGMACFAAINTMLYDTDFESIGQDEKTIDPDDWEACYYASLAMSGSAIWEGKGGAGDRRVFWLWYLKEAISKAWNVLDPLG